MPKLDVFMPFGHYQDYVVQCALTLLAPLILSQHWRILNVNEQSAHHAQSKEAEEGIGWKRKPCAAKEMGGALWTEILQPGTLIQKRSCQPGDSLHCSCHIIVLSPPPG